jgi:hypothetical protein
MKPRFLPALIVLGLWLAPVAGHADKPNPGVIRTMTGVRYVVPDGWEWTDFDGIGPTLRHVATISVDNGKYESPNQFSLGVRDIPDETLTQGWNRLDRDDNRTFAGGATAICKAGPRADGMHYAFEGVIRIGSRALSVSIVDSPTPRFDAGLIEGAFLAVAESAREVPASRTIYHPTLAVAADMLDIGTWSASVSAGSISYGCVARACGKGSDARMFVYPGKVDFPDAVSELTDITTFFKKTAHLKVGAIQRQEITGGGQLAWTEQPGSKRPFLGVARRDGRNYFISVTVDGKLTRSHAEMRADFLALAKSARAWDGQ